MESDKVRWRGYYKFRYGNRLYTRKQARELGRTALTEKGNELHVTNGRGWHTIMRLQKCAWGQKYVDDDKRLRARDRLLHGK